jgi:uncharacterized repeat protein (TIGR03803 family)
MSKRVNRADRSAATIGAASRIGCRIAKRYASVNDSLPDAIMANDKRIMTGRRAMMLRPQPGRWLVWSRFVTSVAMGVIAVSTVAPAQEVSYQVLHHFSDAITEPRRPFAPLIVGVDGYLYGTTSDVDDPLCRGIRCGTVFRLTPEGDLEVLYVFPTTGGNPVLPRIFFQIPDGSLYGATDAGDGTGCGGSGCPMIFRMTADGLTSLHTFDNEIVRAAILGSDGNVYGTTSGGGGFGGRVFRMTLEGDLTTVYAFSGPDGRSPTSLIESDDGSFYGTTFGGGPFNDDGTIFRVTPQGELTTLHEFDGSDGRSPQSLIKTADGSFYGPANEGPHSNVGGEIFQMDPDGLLTVLREFQTSCPQGYKPSALNWADDGFFYGATTASDSPPNAGSIFRMAPDGAITFLFEFSGLHPDDGLYPNNGDFYGTTRFGGELGGGVVFRFGVKP